MPPLIFFDFLFLGEGGGGYSPLCPPAPPLMNEEIVYLEDSEALYVVPGLSLQLTRTQVTAYNMSIIRRNSVNTVAMIVSYTSMTV